MTERVGCTELHIGVCSMYRIAHRCVQHVQNCTSVCAARSIGSATESTWGLSLRQVSPMQVMKVYGGCGCIDPLALNLGCRRWWTVRLHAGCFTPPPHQSDPVDRWFREPVSRKSNPGLFRQNLGQYTDWANPATWETIKPVKGMEFFPKASCLCVALCRRGTAVCTATPCRIEVYRCG